MSEPPPPEGPSDDRPDIAPAPAPIPQPAEGDGPGAVEVAVIAPSAAYESIDTLAVVEAGPETETGVGAAFAVPGLETASGPDVIGPVLEAIAALGEDLGGRIDRLRSQYDRELRAESSREKVVDRLHAELQEYKNDLLLKVMKPIFLDLIQLHDDMGKMADAISGDDGRAAGLLRDFQRGVEDVLYRQGIEPYTAEGEQFDPRRQRAVSTVTADDPSLARTIAARLRPGFAGGEKVIRPELVSVYAARRSAPAPEAGGDAEPVPADPGP